MDEVKTEPRSLPPWLSRAWPVLVLFAAGAHNLYMAWNKWGDLFLDYGRELVIPLGISEGKLLYRDMQYYYGPAAPYLNAALFKMFGPHLLVVVSAGIVSATIVTWLLYRISRFWMSRADATLIAAAFIYLCAFSKTNMNSIFNFATPYSYDATYGLAAAIGSLYFLIRYLKTMNSWTYTASVLLCALSVLCKLEVAFPAAAIHVVFLVVFLFQRQARPMHWLSLLAGTTVVVGVYGLFYLKAGRSLLEDNLLAPIFNPKNKGYVAEIMGFSDLRQSLFDLLPSLLAQLLAIAIVPLSRRWVSPVKFWPILFVIGILVFYPVQPWLVFRPVPLLSLGLTGWLGYTWFRRASIRTEIFPVLLVCVFAAACLSRILLAASASHYGFYFLPPGLIVIGLVYFKLLPEGLGGNAFSSGFRAIAYGFFAIWIVTHHSFYASKYAEHNVLMDTPRGRMELVGDYQKLPLGQQCVATQRLLSRFPPGTRVLCVPLGAGLTFFSGQVHDFPMCQFSPVEFSGKYTTNYFLQLLREHPPDVIVKVEWPMSGWGETSFGGDYCQEAWKWVLDNYRLYTATPGQFIKIYVRPDLDVPEPNFLMGNSP